MNNAPRRRRFRWLTLYSALFLIAACAFLMCFVLFGKHMVGVRDGVHQHYTALCYIRDAIRDLFAGNGFKMVDLQLGQGLDTIGTLSYYGLFDPINWISALFATESMEVCYGLLIGLRLYLIGLFFCVYLRRIHLREDWAVAIAGLVYVCCGFYIKAVPRHPFFSDGGIYLALLLIAVERVLQEKKWLMLTLTAALMLIANYYFAFQTTILVVCYILVRLLFVIREEGVGTAAKRGLSLLGAYLLGAALSAVVFLPVLRYYMGNARLNVQSGYTDSLLHYNLLYYVKLFAYLCAPYATTGDWMHENLCPLVIPALLCLFTCRRRSEAHSLKEDERVVQMRVLFVFALAFACVPLFGKVFNGLGYVCNRWCYGFAFAACVPIAWALPRLWQMDGRRAGQIALCMVCIAALTVACSPVDGMLTALLIAAAAAMLIFAGFLFLSRRRNRRPETGARVTAFLALGCCCVYIATVYLPLGGSFAVDYGTGRFYDTLMNETEAAAMEIDAADTERIDCGAVDDCHSSIFAYSGTGYYWSVIPAHVYAYYRDLQLCTQESAGRLCGLGGSTVLDALASVKYCLRKDAGATTLPGGYALVDTVQQADGDSISVYENENPLPMGYVFADTLSTEVYQTLNAVEKQEALLSCAVVEGGSDALPELATQSVTWSVAEADGVEICDGVITVTKDNGSLLLTFDGLPDSETFLVLDGIRCAEGMGTDGVGVTFESEVGYNYGSICDPSSNFCHDQTGLCACLGSSSAAQTRCRVTFRTSGTFLFDSINVYCLPTQTCTDGIDTLQQSAMTDIYYENNRFGGRVDSQGGVLQIAIPYGEGWTATVDGEQRELFVCGGMYMGLNLEAGSHEIELRYETPGLRTGAMISAGALAITIAAWILTRRKRRSKA